MTGTDSNTELKSVEVPRSLEEFLRNDPRGLLKSAMLPKKSASMGSSVDYLGDAMDELSTFVENHKRFPLQTALHERPLSIELNIVKKEKPDFYAYLLDLTKTEKARAAEKEPQQLISASVSGTTTAVTERIEIPYNMEVKKSGESQENLRAKAILEQASVAPKECTTSDSDIVLDDDIDFEELQDNIESIVRFCNEHQRFPQLHGNARGEAYLSEILYTIQKELKVGKLSLSFEAKSAEQQTHVKELQHFWPQILRFYRRAQRWPEVESKKPREKYFGNLLQDLCNLLFAQELEISLSQCSPENVTQEQEEVANTLASPAGQIEKTNDVEVTDSEDLSEDIREPIPIREQSTLIEASPEPESSVVKTLVTHEEIDSPLLAEPVSTEQIQSLAELEQESAQALSKLTSEYPQLQKPKEDSQQVHDFLEQLLASDPHNLLSMDNIHTSNLMQMQQLLVPSKKNTLQPKLTKVQRKSIDGQVAVGKVCAQFDEKYASLFAVIKQGLSDGDLGYKAISGSKNGSIKLGDIFLVSKTYRLIVDDHSSAQTYRTKAKADQSRIHVISDNGTESTPFDASLQADFYKRDKKAKRIVSKNSKGSRILEQIHKTLTLYLRIKYYAENKRCTTSPVAAARKTDQTSGYVYVLSSCSDDVRLQDVVKIGFTTQTIEERTRSAVTDPTFLCAPITIEQVVACYNFNPQDLETLLHRLFESRRLKVCLTNPHTSESYSPKEWYRIPVETAKDAIRIIFDTKDSLNNYSLDENTGLLIRQK